MKISNVYSVYEPVSLNGSDLTPVKLSADLTSKGLRYYPYIFSAILIGSGLTCLSVLISKVLISIKRNKEIKEIKEVLKESVPPRKVKKVASLKNMEKKFPSETKDSSEDESNEKVYVKDSKFKPAYSEESDEVEFNDIRPFRTEKLSESLENDSTSEMNLDSRSSSSDSNSEM